MEIKDIKKQARADLNDIYPKTVIITFLYIAITFSLDMIINTVVEMAIIPTIIKLIVFLVYIIVFIPIYFGITSTFLDISDKKVLKVTDFIDKAKANFIKVWRVTLRICFRLLVPIVSGIVVGSVAGAIAYLVFNINNPASMEYVITYSSISILFLLYMLAMFLPYALSYIVLADDNTKTSKEIVAESKKLLKNHIWDYLELFISFLGWMILIGVIASLANQYIKIAEIGTVISRAGTVLLLPYILMSQSLFYKALRNEIYPVQGKTEEKPKAKKNKSRGKGKKIKT